MKGFKGMKKVLTLLAIILIAGCGKETTNPGDCNCGTVANDGIDNGCYWLELRNKCTDNKKKFCVDQDKWMRAYVGSDFCITNVNRW